MSIKDGWDDTDLDEPQGYTPPEEAPQNYEQTDIATMNAQQQLNYGNQTTTDPWMDGLLDPTNPFMKGVTAADESDMRVANQTQSGKVFEPGDEPLLAQIRKHEGNYDTMGDIGDGAGISVGAYQFTEKSGRAQELAKRLGVKSVKDLTPELLRSDWGVRTQDELVKEKYFAPAQKSAARHGITDKAAINFLVDTNINGGMANVINRAKKMPGGATLANLKLARKARYRKLARDKPKKFAKYLKGWLRRVDSFV